MGELRSLEKIPNYVLDTLIGQYQCMFDCVFYNDFIEITFHENDFGVVFIKCKNIEVVESLLFIVPIPNNKDEFESLMKILKVI
jgi:hypothetical protein